MPPQSFALVFTLLIVHGVAFPTIARGGTEDAEARIRALEQRVERLENLVEKLSGARAAEAYTAEEVTSAAKRPAEAETIPAAPKFTGRKELPQELLPNLGKIGAMTSFTTGVNSGAYHLGGGSYIGGAVQLPLALAPGGRLSYEFSAGLLQSARHLPTTSNVAQVANLAVLAAIQPGNPSNVANALTGKGAAPFAVTQTAKWQAQTVQIVPIALHYSFTRFDSHRIRPFAVLGLGAYVTTSHQTASAGVRGDASLPQALLQSLSGQFGGAPFSGPLIGGQIASSNELQTTRLPSGQGGTELGIHTGGGVEWLFPSGLSLSLEDRVNVIPGGTTYNTLATRWGWRF